MSDGLAVIWRLTLECGHLRLDGPYEDGESRRMIGDITICEVCPRRDVGGRRELTLRQVVNVERVPGDQYREPTPRAAEARMEVLRGD